MAGTAPRPFASGFCQKCFHGILFRVADGHFKCDSSRMRNRPTPLSTVKELELAQATIPPMPRSQAQIFNAKRQSGIGEIGGHWINGIIVLNRSEAWPVRPPPA